MRSETLGLKRPKKNSPKGVSIRYWVLNGEDILTGGGLRYYYQKIIKK